MLRHMVLAAREAGGGDGAAVAAAWRMRRQRVEVRSGGWRRRRWMFFGRQMGGLMSLRRDCWTSAGTAVARRLWCWCPLSRVRSSAGRSATARREYEIEIRMDELVYWELMRRVLGGTKPSAPVTRPGLYCAKSSARLTRSGAYWARYKTVCTPHSIG